jgi:hypothetical protein
VLTYEDCLGMCDLTQEEIGAIAEHEHCHPLIALELGHHLVQTEEGQPRVLEMIRDDIALARARGDTRHVAELKRVLRKFCERFPRAEAAAVESTEKAAAV